MAATSLGIISWGMTKDSDGHRTYAAKFLVLCSDVDDGPLVVSTATGLPVTGAAWTYGNDSDLWALCYPDVTAKPLVDKEDNKVWEVSKKFSTKPLKRCQTSSIENPINEPPNISGSFVKYTREARFDRSGNALKYSNHQMMSGSITERDYNRPTVKIEKNFAAINLTLITGAVDTVNDATLWGLGTRKIKLSNVSWSRKLYGTCTYYYTVNYEFDIDFNTFDHEVVDQGSMVLASGGDPNNPQDFVQYKDCRGNNQKVLLDGNGNALDDASNPVTATLEHYDETNFLLLGIPTSL